MATLTATPVSGSITAAATFVKIDVSGADQNTNTGYDTDNYPASPAVNYYLTFEKGGSEYGRSYVFGVSEDGDHEFNNYVFPSSGSWTVRLSNAASDASVTTLALTVA